MTFSVVVVESNQRKKVVGTLWASDEAGAYAVAPELVGPNHGGAIQIERSEECEIPLRISEPGFNNPFC
ncbi:MAG: hypothetical protein JWL69_1500 [Phycisphaerales bacterium]|jgi:hypothetical protein|nr:hypothetical protein [Phycisphaerales bacterium]MDB5355287.1 hypothetical protein [Phycisphaerales bacterium]